MFCRTLGDHKMRKAARKPHVVLHAAVPPHQEAVRQLVKPAPPAETKAIGDADFYTGLEKGVQRQRDEIPKPELLNHKAVPLQEIADALSGVAAQMTQGLISLAEESWERRNREDHAAARFHHLHDLRDAGLVILDVVQHVQTDDRIEPVAPDPSHKTCQIPDLSNGGQPLLL